MNKELTFEEAFEEVKKYLDRITVCYEYECAYKFGDNTVEMLGGLQYVGVWKDKTMPIMNEFNFINELAERGIFEPIKEIELDWKRELTFEEAFELAKKEIKQINYCSEYKDAYIFGLETEKPHYGGMDYDVVIYKNGKTGGVTPFIMRPYWEGIPIGKPKKIKIKPWKR